MSTLDRHLSHLLRLTDVEGRAAIDVGCGKGGLVRALSSLGAKVTGVEISSDRVADASARPKVADERYVVGVGESVPADSGSADLVTYLFSLHHVPIPQQGAAIAEASRLLRPGGRLHVADPLPEGPMTEVLQPIEDERAVRTAAHTLMDELDGDGWTLLEKSIYEIERSYAELDDFIAGAVLVDPTRTARLADKRGTLAERFADRAKKRDGRYWLRQPCVLYHLMQASHY